MNIIKHIVQGFLSVFLLLTGQSKQQLTKTLNNLLYKKTVIVCDLGGVLVQPNKRKVSKKIGMSKLIKYALRHSTDTNEIKRRFFALLHEVSTVTETVSGYEYKDANGHSLPKAFQEWLGGHRTHDSVIEGVHTVIEAEQFTFKSKSEREVLLAMTYAIFEPEAFIEGIELMPEAIAFLNECRERGYKLYLLSNWDTHSFEVLAQKYPEFVELFDGITLSGQEGLLKPDPALYKRFFEKQNLNPNECFFIDDQPENIEAAQLLSMDGIVCPVKNKKAHTDFDAILSHLEVIAQQQEEVVA